MTNILGKIAWMPSGSTSPLDYLLLPDAETPVSRDLHTVYVVTCETSPWSKVGFSECAQSRLRDLQIGCPYRLTIAAAVAVAAKGRTIERASHKLLDRYRQHGEWFDVSPLEAVEAILRACKENHTQHWPVDQVYKLQHEALARVNEDARKRELEHLRKNMGWEI